MPPTGSLRSSSVVAGYFAKLGGVCRSSALPLVESAQVIALVRLNESKRARRGRQCVKRTCYVYNSPLRSSFDRTLVGGGVGLLLLGAREPESGGPGPLKMPSAAAGDDGSAKNGARLQQPVSCNVRARFERL